MPKHLWIPSLTLFLLAGAAGYGLVRTFREAGPADSGGGLPPGKAGGAGVVAREKTGSSSARAAFAEARDFLTRLDAAKLEDLPALWASLGSGKEGEDDGAPWPHLRRLMVMERWAELDAPGALEFAKSQKETDTKAMVTGVFSVWGVADPEAAMAVMKEEKDRALLAAEVVGWLRSVSGDPAALIRHASQLSWVDVSGLKKTDFLEQISQDFLETLHAAEPAGLKQLAAWMPPWFAEMLETLDWRKSLRDAPDQALAALESMPLNKDKLADLLSALEPLAKTRPERVADLLTKLADRPGKELWEYNSWQGDQRKLLETLITALGPEQPERLGELLTKTKGNIAGAQIMLDTLLRSHPAAALRAAPGLGNIDQLGEIMFAPPPEMDAGTALELVKGAPASYYRDKIMDRALLDLNRRSPEEAKAWMENLPAGEVRESARLTLELASAPSETRLLERFGHQLSMETGNPDETATKRLQLLTAMAGADDPQGIREKVSAWSAGPAREIALGMLATQTATRDDPLKAIQWAGSLPEESQRAAAYEGAAKGWTQTDPVAASEWVAALPEGTVREAAVGAFAVEITKRDPEAGLQWAATLANPDDRLRRLRDVTEIWKIQDAPTAAEAVRDLPGLSDTDRTALLQSLK